MDGGGKCRQRQLGQLDIDQKCMCPFCTEDRLETKFLEPARYSAARDGDASTAAVLGGARMERDSGADASSVRLESTQGGGVGAADRFMPAQISNRKLQPDGGTKSLSRQCPSLVSLCVGYLGEHLEDLIEDIHVISPAFPSDVKGKLLAVARRRGLLCDELLVALADNSWEILDVSGSDVTDSSLVAAASVCPRLQDVDISQCSLLTSAAVRALVEHCPSLRTLRCGGMSISDAAARSSLSYILPRLNRNEEAEESWEVLDTKPVGEGAQALRWLVWPAIDSKSRERLGIECPRIVINPVFSWRTYGVVPRAAQPGVVLDSLLLEDIDPKTWAVVTSARLHKPGLNNNDGTEGVSVAERFRLAFISRDERLAPKRAKNMRQNQRRAEKAWLSSDTEAKAHAWAGLARKSLKNLVL